MPFFPAAIARRLLRRKVNPNVENEDFVTLPRGPVKKLVVLDGCWKDRRWNDRWLEAVSEFSSSDIPTELRYSTHNGGKFVNRILSNEITHIQAIDDEEQLCLSGREVSFKYRSFQGDIDDEDGGLTSKHPIPTLRALIIKHREDFKEVQYSFLIRTKPNSSVLDQGHEFLFKTRSAEEMQIWVDTIKRMIAEPAGRTLYSRLKSNARVLYKSKTFQVGVALTIGINFLANIYDAQTNPTRDSNEGQMLWTFDLVIAILFALELCFNFFTCLNLSEFFKDYWNW